MLSNIQSLNANSGTLQSINYKYAPDTGIVVYSIDGYEDLTLEKMNSAVFDNSTYEKQQLINNALVKAGDPVYKLCTSEEWSVIIEEDDEKKVLELLDLEYVKVRFIKNQDESWGKVSAYTNADGESFVQLTFTNSMITFCRDRFLNIELITEDDTGLKIPNSAIVDKNFYLVPKDYVIKNNDNSTAVLRVKYDEQGNETSEIVAVSIYNETETVFYLDTDTLRSGDTLIKTDSNDRFTVSKTDSLIGVYNINKGYADFRQISILYQNEEYSIVRSNTTYGLNVYDYIVLDSTTVDANAKSAQENAIDSTIENESGSDSATTEAPDSLDESDSLEQEENLEEIEADTSEDSSEDSSEENSSGELDDSNTESSSEDDNTVTN